MVKAKSSKGGPGRGQGRKPKPKIVLDGRTTNSKEIADEALSTVDEAAYWRRLIRAECDTDTKWFALSFEERKEAAINYRHLTERKYGKSVEKLQVDGLPPQVVDNSVRVEIVHIGSKA